jgi:hypothetical protein
LVKHPSEGITEIGQHLIVALCVHPYFNIAITCGLHLIPIESHPLGFVVHRFGHQSKHQTSVFPKELIILSVW